MRIHDAFDGRPLHVRTGQGSPIEQHAANIFRQLIAIPHAEMHRLMTTQKESLQMDRREQMIGARQPLWHPVVIGVLGLEREFLDGMRQPLEWPRSAAYSTVGRNPTERRVPVGD